MSGDRSDHAGKSIVAQADAAAGVKSALARWVLHKRRALLAGVRPAAHDEATHAWDGRRRFAEDYVFAAMQHGLGLLVRLEWLPGRASHRVWVMLLRDDAAWWLPPAQTLVTESRHDRWRVGGLHLDCLQPLQRWRVHFVGDVIATEGAPRRRRCELALEFDAAMEPFVPGVDDDPELVARRVGEAAWDRELAKAVRRSSQRGYVQIGRLRGQAVLADEIVAIDADCVRTHSWGVRDWGAPEHAVQCLVRHGESITWIQRAQFPVLTYEGGFVVRDGEVRCVREIARAERIADLHHLEIDDGRGPLQFVGAQRRAAALRVDGRGDFELALCGDGDTRALWVTQQRTLPRPPARP